MNSENQIWALIWNSLLEVPVTGESRGEPVPLGRDKTLSDAEEKKKKPARQQLYFVWFLDKVALRGKYGRKGILKEKKLIG